MSCAIRLDGFGFTPEAINEAVKNRRLLSMEIEFGRACNFRCPYCYVENPKKAPQELSGDEIRDVIDQAKELGALKIIMLGGEPMLFPGLQEMIAYITGKGMEIEIFTNGTNVTPEMAGFFFEHGVKVVVKLNTFDEALQNKLTGCKWAYDCIQTALSNLLAAGYPTREKRIAASTIIGRQNIGELPELWRWLRDRDIDPYFEMITPQGRSRRNQWLDPEPDDVEKVFHAISQIDRKEYGREWEPQPPLVGNKCVRNRFTCLVNAYGDVMPCVGITIPAGNIRQRPLQNILSDSIMFDDLRNFSARIKGPCSDCERSEECYGCRGAAYQLTGDYLASDPLCWHNKDRIDEIIHLPFDAALFAPQKNPMLLIDTLVSVGDGAAVAETRIRAENAFVDDSGLLDSTAYLEMLAQTVAVTNGFKTHGRSDSAACGLLLGTKNLHINGVARVDDLLTLSIQHAASFGPYSIFTGTVARGEEILATGELKVWERKAVNAGTEENKPAGETIPQRAVEPTPA